MTWIKKHSQLYVSENGHYAIAGRYTYYQGWESYHLPNGERGDWIRLDGMYKGKGALAACRSICVEHSQNSLSKV